MKKSKPSLGPDKTPQWETQAIAIFRESVPIMGSKPQERWFRSIGLYSSLKDAKADFHGEVIWPACDAEGKPYTFRVPVKEGE